MEYETFLVSWLWFHYPFNLGRIYCTQNHYSECKRKQVLFPSLLYRDIIDHVTCLDDNILVMSYDSN